MTKERTVKRTGEENEEGGGTGREKNERAKDRRGNGETREDKIRKM